MTESNSVPMINNVHVFSRGIKLLSADLPPTSFHSNNHLVLLDLKLKPGKCLDFIFKARSTMAL